MKIRRRFWAVLAAVFILSDSYSVFAANPEQIQEETITEKGAESTTTDQTETENETDFPIPDQAPAFHARIAYRMGYTVIGTFTDFTPDITQIETLTSLDGENWQIGRVTWNLFHLGSDDENKLKALQNQSCLFSSYEPLKSYLSGKIDHFYLKLRITKENGLSYETQPAVIERGGLQPIPEGTNCHAVFSPSIAVREPDPDSLYHYRRYGRYHLTVSEAATAKEILSLLPDTLPVEIQLEHGADFVAIGTVDCPVTWKPLSLPRLVAGESITIADAAEEIFVPGDTQVSTPLGIFSLDEPLNLDSPPSTDEVRLVLNVCPVSGGPAGVLKAGLNGLEMAFNHYPSGACSIQAYILTEGEMKWTELSGLSLLDELFQPATENSGYALLLRNDQEPYRSYLSDTAAGKTPTPFFIGLEIKGGIYDNRQLILAWPDIYDELPDLPKFGGAQGNEGNAGAGNKNDSTEGGQRPNLPQIPEENPAEQITTAPPDPDASLEIQTEAPASMTVLIPEESLAALSPVTDINLEEQPTITTPVADTSHNLIEQQTTLALTSETASLISEPQSISTAHIPASAHQSEPESPFPSSTEEPASEQQSEHQEDQLVTGQRPNLPLPPVTTAIAAGGCIGVAVCKAKGISLLHWIAGKIRKLLPK